MQLSAVIIFTFPFTRWRHLSHAVCYTPLLRMTPANKLCGHLSSCWALVIFVDCV